MLQHSFENVREQLLKAGIAPRHVGRYVTELREHLADLVARERATGLDAREAEARARTILGSDAQLTQAMLDRSPPRSWAVKAPWAVFGILPVVAIIAAVAVVAMTMMNLLWPVSNLLPAQMPASYQALIMAATILTGYVIGPVLAAGAIAIALRQRLASSWVWTGLVLIALFSGFFVFHPPSGPGDMYRATGLVMADGHISVAATLGLLALRATVLFTLSALAYRALKARQTTAPV
jgi:hypothetical protein